MSDRNELSLPLFRINCTCGVVLRVEPDGDYLAARCKKCRYFYLSEMREDEDDELTQ
jgi:hypothetical protein